VSGGDDQEDGKREESHGLAIESHSASELWFCQRRVCKRTGDCRVPWQSAAVQIVLINRQRRVRFDAERLRRLAELSLTECVGHSGDARFALKRFALVEVAVVSDAVIARVHRQFMGVSGATDVITFAHGEIVVSADTARAQAAEHGHGIVEELALYVIHGLLHLNGYGDITSRDRVKMHRTQDRIWHHVLAAEFPLSENLPCKIRRKAL
jgi:probable rRNA maturation factor